MEAGREEEDGVLVKDAGGAVLDSESMDEGSDSLELRTTWWAPSCRPSLLARVTSMMLAAPWFTVLESQISSPGILLYVFHFFVLQKGSFSSQPWELGACPPWCPRRT